MFNFTGWVLDQPKFATHEEEIMAYVHPKGVVHRQDRDRQSCCDQELGQVPAYRSAIIQRYDFASGLNRMSVICKNEIDQRYRVFTKGAPEKLAELCHPDSLP